MGNDVARSKIVGWGSIVAAAQMLSGVVRNKALSVAIGTSGVGLIAESQQLATTIFVPATALSGPALTRAVVTSQQTPAADPRPALDTLLTLVVTMTVGIVSVGFAVALTLRNSPLASAGLQVVMLPLLTSGATALSGGFSQVLIAAGLPAEQARVQISSALVSAVAAATLAFPYGVSGALAGTLVGQLVAVGLVLHSCLGHPRLAGWRPRFRVEKSFIVDSLRFGATGFVAAAALQAGLLAVRTALSADGHSDLNGLFQASWALGYTYLGLIFAGFSNYFFPRIAASSYGAATLSETSLATRFIVGLVVPLALIAIPLRHFVISTLYSSEFLGAAGLLGVMLSVAPLRALGLTYGGSLLFQSRLRTYAVLEVVGATIHGVGAVCAAPRWGLLGVGTAYAASYLVYAWGCWFTVIIGNEGSLRPLEPLLATLASAALLVVCLLPQAPEYQGLGIAVVGAIALALVGRPLLRDVLARRR